MSIVRWTGIAGLAYVVLYVSAFAMGIEFGHTDREILDHYADSGARTREIVAFFLIVGAALAFLLFGTGLRALIAQADGPRTLAALTFAGTVCYVALVLAANAVSRGTAFAAADEELMLDPNAWRLLEQVGFLLFVSAALSAIPLVGAVSVAMRRHALAPRWLAWVGLVAAPLLVTSIGFIGFLVLALWVILVSIALLARRWHDAEAARVPAA